MTIKEIHEKTGIAKNYLGNLVKRKLTLNVDYSFLKGCIVLSGNGYEKFKPILDKVKTRKFRPDELPKIVIPPDYRLTPIQSDEVKQKAYLAQLDTLPLQRQPEAVKRKFMRSLRLNPVMREILFN